MERVGLGRTPMREALRTLAQRAARRDLPAPRHPRRAASTSATWRASPRCAGELEPLARAARRRARDRRRPRRHEQLLAELDAARDTTSARLIELDQRIHRHVHRCAHNPFLEATLEEYYFLTCASGSSRSTASRRSRTRCTSTATCSRRSATATPTRAEAAMRRHVDGFERRSAPCLTLPPTTTRRTRPHEQHLPDPRPRRRHRLRHRRQQPRLPPDAGSAGRTSS